MAANSPLDKLTFTQRSLVAVALLIVAGIVVGIRGCQEQPGAQPGPEPRPPGEWGKPLANRNVKFGYPAEAKADPAHKDAYLLERPQYVLSYNDSKRTPNWVCWNVNKADIGNTKRATSFDPDPDLPKSFAHVKSSDYTLSGFDRGHLCPAKDRSDTKENNEITFYTTNIMPQSPACNRGGWERFESYCRDLTRDGSEVYIAAGPHGQGGTGEIEKDGVKEQVKRDTVGRDGKIVVPAACWKVVLVLPSKEEMPTHLTRALAVWMPNDQTVPEDWKPYAVSVAEVEKRTGYKFFPVVPDDVGAPIKARVDRGP